MDSAHTLKPRTSTASLSRCALLLLHPTSPPSHSRTRTDTLRMPFNSLTDSTNTHHAPSTSLYTSSSPLKPSLAPHTPTGSRALPQSTSTASDLAGQLADLSLDEGSTSAIGGEEGEQRREQADRADGGVADKGSSGGEGAVHDGTTMNGTNGSSARNASSTRPS